MKPSIIDLNNLSDEETNQFALKFLSLLKNKINNDKEELYEVLKEKLKEIYTSHLRIKMLSDSFREIKNKSHKNNIIEGLFELILFFEISEEYESCVILKKIKDNLLMDFN